MEYVDCSQHDRVLAFSPTRCSAGLRNLSRLAQACLRILVLLPADRKHGVTGFARGHDDTQLVARSREVVVCLVTEGYLRRGIC